MCRKETAHSLTLQGGTHSLSWGSTYNLHP